MCNMEEELVDDPTDRNCHNNRADKDGSLRVEKENSARVEKVKLLPEKVLQCVSADYAIYKNNQLIRKERENKLKEKPFKCTQCSYASSYKSNLNAHVKIHTGKKPFKCTMCPYAACKRETLNTHFRKHTGEKPFKCTLCDYASKVKHGLNNHLKSHLKEKPFKCAYCPYAAAVKDSLIVHERKHTGEKPYKCDQCDYAATEKAGLIKHTRRHTGEKPYKCSYCPYACRESSSLTTHLRKHTGEKPFKCHLCDYSCNNRSSLAKHSVSHSGDRAFNCKICKYNSSDQLRFIAHARKHFAQKPFKCSVCDKTFRKETSLLKHEKKHLKTTCLPSSSSHSTPRPVKSKRKRKKRDTSPAFVYYDSENYSRSSVRESSLIYDNHSTSPHRLGEGSSEVEKNRISENGTENDCVFKHETKNVSSKKFKCTFCSYVSRIKDHVKKHEMKHASNNPLKCALCDQSFSRQSDLARHLYKHIFKKNQLKKRPIVSRQNADDSNGSFPVSSIANDTDLASTRSLVDKSPLLYKLTKNDCVSREQNDKKNDENPFECEESDRSFANESSFSRNMELRESSLEHPHSDCHIEEAEYSRPSNGSEFDKFSVNNIFDLENTIQPFRNSADSNIGISSIYFKNNKFTHEAVLKSCYIAIPRLPREVIKWYTKQKTPYSFIKNKVQIERQETNHSVHVENSALVSISSSCYEKTSLDGRDTTGSFGYLYNCAHCYFSCDDKYDLIKHRMNHTAKDTFKCGICVKTFRTKFRLLRHEQTHVFTENFKPKMKMRKLEKIDKEVFKDKDTCSPIKETAQSSPSKLMVSDVVSIGMIIHDHCYASERGEDWNQAFIPIKLDPDREDLTYVPQQLSCHVPISRLSEEEILRYRKGTPEDQEYVGNDLESKDCLKAIVSEYQSFGLAGGGEGGVPDFVVPLKIIKTEPFDENDF